MYPSDCYDGKCQLEWPMEKVSLDPGAQEFIPRGFMHRFMNYPYRGEARKGNMRDQNGYFYSYHKPSISNYNNHHRRRHFEHAAPKKEQRKKNQKGKQRKFSYRSKQNKIDVVLGNLKKQFASLDKLAGKEEVLRGKDTLRIDVKRFTALQQIEKEIEAIEKDPRIQITKADFPISQKNKFQKKGFIAYLKCATPEQAELLHTQLSEKTDPKWRDKKLFRVNIALDQQRDHFDAKVNRNETRSFHQSPSEINRSWSSGKCSIESGSSEEVEFSPTFSVATDPSSSTAVGPKIPVERFHYHSDDEDYYHDVCTESLAPLKSGWWEHRNDEQLLQQMSVLSLSGNENAPREKEYYCKSNDIYQ